ncbi:HupE/UreJ family protein [Actinoplanes sp. NPDC089786]|uniref:HupE/UreJ family protein n=1 Tax=Actinoplanes sp. NPDC089786 TaxID=3155185 RepID=UPI0034486137
MRQRAVRAAHPGEQQLRCGEGVVSVACRFQDVEVPPGDMIGRLVAFNVGVELGQFLCLYLLYLLGDVRRTPAVAAGRAGAVRRAGHRGAGAVAASALTTADGRLALLHVRGIYSVVARVVAPLPSRYDRP